MAEPQLGGTTGWNAFFVKIALGPLAGAPVEIRTKLLATIVQRPLTMIVTSTGIISTCVVATLITRETWALAWLGIMVLFVAWRALLPFWPMTPDRFIANVIIGTIVMFAAVGTGCALCFATGDRILGVTAAGTALGSAAGLASRWAAIPRLAMFTMATTSLPLAAAMLLPGGMTMLLGFQLAIVVISFGTMAVHNHANLSRMIWSEHAHQKLARTDSLTGLANRSHLDDSLTAICQSLHRKENRKFALLYLDLDGFKAVNDQHGHDAGDRLLCDVSEELRFLTRANDIVARVGGDEFIIVLDDTDEQDAAVIAQRIIQRMTRDYALDNDRMARIGCSVGIAVAPRNGLTPTLLISRADMALYAAKRSGKGTFSVWNDSEEPAQAA
jgi:diguanylate cyclase